MKKKYLFITLFLYIAQFTSVFAQSTDYIQVVLYGQSLGMGWQAPRAITTVPLVDNYMTGSNVNTLYSSGNTTLNPLVSAKWKSGGEQPIVSCLNAYSVAYRNQINANQKFIAVTAGEGGQTIERLSKECTNDGYYESTFIQSLDDTIDAINGQSVSCPAIIYMQGEHSSVAWRAAGKGLTPGTNGTLDKTVYKDLLLILKNNMQADIMTKYGQAEKPIFFIYQTSGGYIKIKDMPVVMAQIEFAEENSDVVLLNPHYALPDYSNGHLSTNGYRWYGELMSKSLISELVNNSPSKTLKPTNFDVDGQKITIDYDVPVLPLVLDTWTTPMQTNYGFEVYKNNSVVTISSVEIINNNQVEITCNTDLLGSIEIIYAGFNVNGSGNLRDSDSAVSMYTYFDDSGDALQESYTPTTQNGGSIYGQPYGMQNWSNMFYYDLGVHGATDNLAMLGSASQSTSRPSDGFASNAIDGNTNGVWINNSVTHTGGSETNPWWQVELGSEKVIGEINIFGRTDSCCKARLTDFTVFVIDLNGQTTFSQTFTSYPDPSETVNANGAQGKIIKIVLNGTDALSLAEVEVFEYNALSVLHTTLNDIKIYPNPINNNFTITNSLGADIELYDVVGKLMMKNKIESNSEFVDVSHLKTGLYFVRLTGNNVGVIKKINIL